MAYIGQEPANSFISFEKQVFTIVNSQTAYTLSHAITNENDIRLVVNNVIQEPGSGKAYTASGTTLTLSAALVNGTDEMYCIYLGRALQTVNAPDGSISNSQVAPTIVTGQTAETTVADDDTVLIHDTSASALRKMTVSNLTANAGVAGISSSADATAMTITSNENVGIGITDPDSYDSTAHELVVGKTDAESGITIRSSSTAGNLYFADGTTGAEKYQGYIQYDHNNGFLNFGSGASTRLKINSSGKVLVNGTSTSFNTKLLSEFAGGEYGMQLNSTATSGTQYHLTFTRGGTEAGYLTSTSATAVNLNNASDERLKENIQNSGSAIQDLKDIQVRQFDWKDEIDTHKDFGFVAQELVNVVPEAVTQGSDELNENGRPVRTWGVDYSHIVPRLVKVCQEQQTKIEELEARITTLENA